MFVITSPPPFAGDEDVPHVQHWQHQCRIQTEGGGEAGGETDGSLRSTRRQTDATLPWHLGQHQKWRETHPPFQCQKNREDEGEGETLGRGSSTCCLCFPWMIYESVSGLLPTLFVPAGNCHGRIVLLSVISTEASPSTIYYTVFSFFCHSCWISVLLLLIDCIFLGLALIRDKQSTQRTGWRPSRLGMNTCWHWRPPTAASSNITSTICPTSLTWV